MKTLYWIFPCYNEEACLPNSFNAISETFNNFVEEELISNPLFMRSFSKRKIYAKHKLAL